MIDELQKIIYKNDINTFFQPIISLNTGEVMGYEAFSRVPDNSTFENNQELFEDAKSQGLLWNLEFICRANSIKRFRSFNVPKNLFINVDAEVIKEENFAKALTEEILEEYHILPSTITFEVTGKSFIKDYEGFNRVIELYKQQGYSIAIDDLGMGYSVLTTVAEVKPKYIKIGKNLISNIAEDNLKKGIVKAFVDFAEASAMKVIAYAIETLDELNTLIDIGVHYGQGYYLQMPSETVSDIDNETREIILERNEIINRHRLTSKLSIRVGEIARHDMPIHENMLCVDVEKMFKQNQNIHGIVVVNDEKKILGLIMRDNFFSRIATQYGWALYMNKPIKKLMDLNPLIVEYSTTIDRLTKAITSREEKKLYDYVIVAKDGIYYGVMPVISLLEKIMETELNAAKQSNPLTGLMGNVSIENKLKNVLDSDGDFSVLYFDLNDFKAYNDIYGFSAGDKIIRYTSNILQRHLYFHKDSFLGHIGGDDFIAVLSNRDVKELCRHMCEEFDYNICKFYNDEDRERGGIISKDRNGDISKFSLMSLAIAVVQNSEQIKTIEDISLKAAELKKRAKQESKKYKKSSFCVE